MNKLVSLLAIGLVLVAVVGCSKGSQATPQGGTPTDTGQPTAPVDEQAEVDTQLDEPQDVEIGEIV